MYDFDNLIQKLTLNKFIILKLYSNTMKKTSTPSSSAIGIRSI